MVSTPARCVVAVAVTAALVGGCAGDGSLAAADEPIAAAPNLDNPASLGQRVDVVVGPAPSLLVEISDTPDERSQGLMHRERLDPGAGMIFLFPSARDSAFWMYQTLIPLSIAWAADGRVVGIAEMEPCVHANAADCPRYPSPAEYDMAIEAPAGTFTNAGVRAGDEIRIIGTLPAPTG